MELYRNKQTLIIGQDDGNLRVCHLIVFDIGVVVRLQDESVVPYVQGTQ